ncbi:MAG TPA: butyrate kinase, partial [Acholeplasmataceae bacterium]|nr:butyrate kinase [Acholeplasmataceae bacterium]
MTYKILTINPGSTSTKLAIFENENCVWKVNVKHDSNVIDKFDHVIDQYDFRMNAIMEELKKSKIDLSTLHTIVGRGGMLKPIEGGTYIINDDMV